MTALKPTFEDAVALLANKPTPAFLADNSVAIYAGFMDLASRLANLEHASLEATFKLANLEDAQNKTAQIVTAVEAEHTDLKKRFAVLEGKPAADDKKIADFDKRLRTVEGAVGSSNFKKPLLVPATAKLDEPKPFVPTPVAPEKPAVNG